MYSSAKGYEQKRPCYDGPSIEQTACPLKSAHLISRDNPSAQSAGPQSFMIKIALGISVGSLRTAHTIPGSRYHSTT
jgi:uncharacterized ferredoxin-like protein